MLRIIKIYFFPLVFLILPALVGLGFEAYNRYYRGISTPFLYPALGLILISLFFWVRRRWAYFVLVGVTAAYLLFFFQYLLWADSNPSSLVYYYQKWEVDTQSGRIALSNPLGSHPPSTGSYISCNFSLKSWPDYLNNQPSLCTAFDSQLRLKMFLNDHQTDVGPLREIQLNEFRVDRKSLLGEPLDRSALRVAFVLSKGGFRTKYSIKAIYQVYEREIKPGKNKIVESFSRDSEGNLKNFTESPFLAFSSRDVYAVYNADGILVKIPRMRHHRFSFPAQIDVRHYQKFNLAEKLRSEPST